MKLFFYILLGLGVLATIATIRGLIVGDLFARGPLVTGLIVGIQESTAASARIEERKTKIYAPVIEIEYPVGSKVQLRHATGWSAQVAFAVGQTVPIRVNEANPALSMENTFFRNVGVPFIKILAPIALFVLAFAVRRFLIE